MCIRDSYRADAQGEKWLKQADAILQKETIGVMSQDEIKTLAGNVALELGCNVDEKTGYISTDTVSYTHLTSFKRYDRQKKTL